METLSIQHRTVYRYAKPVRFGEHRLMFRPRDSHDLRHVSSQLSIAPKAQIRWYHDVFNNSIAIADFEGAESDELIFDSNVVVEHYGSDDIEFPIEHHARQLPFAYSSEEIQDLARCNERHYADRNRQVDVWAQSFLTEARSQTDYVLANMTRDISANFNYVERQEEGTQKPLETLNSRRGTCRDFALLMMEAARALGIATRFVTGYLFDPTYGEPAQPNLLQNGSNAPLRGAGATHAWVQAYLPGAGWIEYDPTNGIVGGSNLIRVAVARDPSQAIVVQGSYYGAAEDFLDMTVNVDVRPTF